MGSKTAITVIPVKQETMALFGHNCESMERRVVFDLPDRRGGFLGMTRATLQALKMLSTITHHLLLKMSLAEWIRV